MSDLRTSANRVVALVVGAALLLLGAVGIVISWGTPIFDPAGVLLLETMSLNPAQSIVHLVLGGGLVAAAWRGRTAARLQNRFVGVLLLALGLAGLFLSSTPANVVAVNGAANLVHFMASTTLLAVGLGTDSRPAAR